ncbi:phosphatase PAP2 family protein [Frankia sp. CNm7]|nr:phosphatase PAP2 family protein [Frankia nepalensis]MBL7523289.1 phosphatase PAP2 family protein [Frankia nepalensis]
MPAAASRRGPASSLTSQISFADQAGTSPPAEEEPRPRWWLELVSIASLYGLYTAVRGLKSDNLASADATGRELLRLENLWHLNPEHTLNDLLAQVTALAVPACYFYATLHYILTPAVLVWIYRRRPGHYRVARSTILLATILGLVGFWLLPTTPPRLLDGSGYHDTMAEVSSWGWWGGDASAPRGMGGLTNQYAAMPSLHCGWALWCGYLLARHARGRVVRVLGACYPVLTTLVVMATANHYLLDAVAGFVDVLVAVAIVLLVRRAWRRRSRLTPEDERRTPGGPLDRAPLPDGTRPSARPAPEPASGAAPG